MTAKEKAKELYRDFVGVVGYELAKECASIAVDFHIAEFIDVYGDDLIDNIEYWKEVKKEINGI